MKTRGHGAQPGARSAMLFAIAAIFSALMVPLGILLLGAPSIAKDEQEIALKTRVAAATVYADQARVTRTGALDLSAGLYRLVCDDLPQGFAEPSLQVEGKGTAQARILGVDVIKMQGNAAESPRFKELKQKLELLTAKRDTLQIERNALGGSLAYLDSYAKFPFEKADTKITTEVFRVQDWKNVLDFVGSERVKTNEKIDGLDRRTKKLTEEIDWINGQLNEMKTKDDWGKRVAIDCEVTAPGNLRLEITYNVPGAGWMPEYVLRYGTGDEAVELAYNARVRQSTGEDWQEVAVTLSTAQPQLGAAPPEITPLYLQRIVRPVPVYGVNEAVALKSGKVKKADELSVAEAPPAQEFEAERAGAELVSSEFAATFSIPKAVNLQSGADPRRVLIVQEKLAGKLSRYGAPRLSPNVFVKGAVKNTLDVPLLAGEAEVYVETTPAGGQGKTSNFVGREVVKAVASGEEFAVHLGIDQDFKVTQKLEKKEYLTKEGALTRKIRYHYLMTLESFKKEAVAVAIQDRIPVSTMKEIKVADVDLDPKPSEEREDGILTWNLNPVPKQKIEIRSAYTIEMPGDWPEYSINKE